MTRIKNWISHRFEQWLQRRIPRKSEILLNQRRIFIFPTAYGFFFILLLFFMLIGAINYQSNLMFAFLFLLVGLFVVAILFTYRNLSGLVITAGQVAPVFAGETTLFQFFLSAEKNSHFALEIKFKADSRTQLIERVILDRLTIEVPITAKQRGWFHPGRLLIQTLYPLGLLRAWSWLDMEAYGLVYPVPRDSSRQLTTQMAQPSGEQSIQAGMEELYSLRTYREGDSLKQVAWKQLAKGQGMYTKEFVDYIGNSYWLDWEQFQGLDIEERLSALCYWILKLEQNHELYGLRLPENEISPGQGEAHKTACLRALALYTHHE